jgi:uncharacterized repeat protein (TIGR03987 family)
MTETAMLAGSLIGLALIFYSIGVWSERFAGRLKPWHLIFFWGGLAFDTVGTGIMMEMAEGLTMDLHGLTGVVAILLMAVHAVWATIVLIERDEKMIISFHRFSVLVWTIWLIPFVSGMFISMA